MSAPAPARPSAVVTIQYLRGIAASLVVLYHAMNMPPLGPSAPLRFGEFGVDLFFVISGYIMWTTTADSGRGPGSFWAARILRVVPLYWLCTACYLAVAILRPSALFNPAFDPLYIVKSFLFIPAAHPTLGALVPVYSLGWTLNYEMFFYLVFGLCLLIPSRPVRLSATIGALCILVITGLIVAPNDPVAITYTNPILLEFAGGILLAWLMPRVRAAPRLGCALIAAALIWLVISQVLAAPPQRAFTFGIPAAIIVAGALLLEPIARTRPNRVALLLGNASYSIYLAHPFGQRLLYLALGAGFATSPATIALGVLLMLFVGIAAGLVCYFVVERPILRFGHRLLKAPRAT